MKRVFALMLVLVVALLASGITPAFALQDDGVFSQHIAEADGTSGQNTNSGNGIKTGHIQDAAVTSDKLADGAVSSAKIANSSVTSDKIDDGAVTDAKITGPISSSKISSSGLDADKVDGLHASAFQKNYDNVVVVSEDGNGDYTSISSALSSITDASSSNTYIIRINPGIYNETGVVMKNYVNIIGSSRENTTITSSNQYWTVEWGSGITATLEDVKVTGYMYANNATLATIKDVEAVTTDYDVLYVAGTSTVEVIDSKFLLDGYDEGIKVGNTSTLKISNSEILLESGSQTMNEGISSVYSATLLITDSVIDMTTSGWAVGITGFTGILKDSTVTIHADDGAYAVMTVEAEIINSEVIVNTATDDYGAYGVDSGYAYIRNSEIIVDVTSPNTDTFGVTTAGTIKNSSVSSAGDAVKISSGTVTIDSSTISGNSNGIVKSGSGVFKIGASQIVGGHNGSSGTDKVVNCYDGSYNAISDL